MLRLVRYELVGVETDGADDVEKLDVGGRDVGSLKASPCPVQ